MHICQTEYAHLDGMRAFYDAVKTYPSSPNGDEMLIRSHIAYWSGSQTAERASIKPSRGYSYRVAPHGTHSKSDVIVRVVDNYDHREGVTGWR